MASPKTRWQIEVTQADIDRATRNDSYLCVVSQAIARTITDATRIEVDTQAIRFTIGDQRYVYLTPYAVQGYVIAFDAGDEILPFSFRLDRHQVSKARRRTAAGKAVDRATAAARRAAEKEQKAAAAPTTKRKRTAPPPADPKTAARAAYASAVADVPAGEPLSTRSGRKPQRRVFKQRTRAYGHRTLRINQDKT